MRCTSAALNKLPKRPSRVVVSCGNVSCPSAANVAGAYDPELVPFGVIGIPIQNSLIIVDQVNSKALTITLWIKPAAAEVGKLRLFDKAGIALQTEHFSDRL